MSAPRIAISKLRRLAELYVVNRPPSIRCLSKILRVSRSTISKYQRCIRDSGYSFEDFAVLPPAQMHVSLSQHIGDSAPRERYLRLLTVFPQVYRNVNDL